MPDTDLKFGRSRTTSLPLPHVTIAQPPKEETELLHAPDPVGHFMLVALPTMEEKTAGGIYIPDSVTDRERAASVVGHVIALGPDCYTGQYPNGAPRFPSGAWCKEGDTVLFSRYQGMRFKIEGVEFRMLADDQIVATVPNEAKVGGL